MTTMQPNVNTALSDLHDPRKEYLQQQRPEDIAAHSPSDLVDGDRVGSNKSQRFP